MTTKQINQRLKKEGYRIKFYKDTEVTEITGNNIQGFVSYKEGNEKCSSYVVLRFAVDHVDCFDKVSRCPILLPIPKNKEELDHLISEMKRLGTKEGYKRSNKYDYIPATEYFKQS